MIFGRMVCVVVFRSRFIDSALNYLLFVIDLDVYLLFIRFVK